MRRRRDALHAIFGLEPEETSILLRRELGLDDLRCTNVPLEEMFVELMGGES